MQTELNATVLDRVEVSPGLVILRVAPDGWILPDFRAGQFAVVGLPYGAPRCELATAEEAKDHSDKLIKRAYSIASSSIAKEYVEIYISLVPSGALTPRLFALQVGDHIWLGKKMSGVFTLDEVPEGQRLVLIGTGTGLAPYMSMLRTHSMCGQRQIAVLHGARHTWELGYRSELAMLAHQCPTFSYIPAISRPSEENVPWAGDTGRIQEVWRRQPLAARWGAQPSPSDSHIFLCGNPGMIEDMASILIEEGFAEHSKKSPGQIHLERFW